MIQTFARRHLTDSTPFPSTHTHPNKNQRALFWPTQIFASVLLVFFEEYNESGCFTVRK